jgi:ribosomal protein S18 acetylase RimI-like enzyme
MPITFQQLTKSNIKDAGQCNGEFVIDSQLALHLEGDELRYTIVPRPSTTKGYETAEIDYPTYLNNPDKAVYLAYVDGQVAGELVLYKNWNNLAYIYYIVVDVDFRKQGIGRALIGQAKQWAKEKGLPGLMLETQTNNIPACKFYERCGFKPGGFDKYLYAASEDSIGEIALFFYDFFQDSESN